MATPDPPPAGGRLKRLTRRALFATIPLVVMLLVVEGLFRLTGTGGYEPPPPTRSIGEAVAAKAPGGRESMYRRVLSYGVPVRMNELGFRGWLLHEEKPGDVFRVAAMGDSFTFGSGVEDDDEWPAQLATALGDQVPEGRRVEVVNFGARGANTAEELPLLRKHALRFDPDVVVLGFTLFNDAETRAHYDAQTKHRVRSRESRPMRATANWLKRNSHAVHFVIERLRRDLKRRALIDHLRNQYAEDAAGWIECRAALRTMADQCAEANVPFIVVLLPTVLQDTALNDFANYEPQDVNATIRAALADKPGAQVLDAAPALIPVQDQRLWIYGDKHPNRLYYEHVAGLLVKPVLELMKD